MKSDQIPRLRELKEEYDARLKEIINPNNYDWEDIGHDGPVPGYESVENYLFSHEDYDECEKVEILVVEEIIQKLEDILEEK